MQVVAKAGFAVMLIASSVGLMASGDTDSSAGGDKKSSETTLKAGVSDVTITSCAYPADNEFEGPQAKLKVTNSSSKPSTYFITVAFNSPDGATQLDTGNAAVQKLEPGQSTEVEATSIKSDLRKSTPKFDCKVSDVTRTAF